MKDRLLGDTIRAARMEKGYTQEKLSELLDITLVHLANIEGGRPQSICPPPFSDDGTAGLLRGCTGISGPGREPGFAYQRADRTAD